MSGTELETTLNDKKKGRINRTRSRNNSRSNSRANYPITKVTANETWKCYMCKMPFSSPDDKLLECQRCNEHFCIKCLNKTEEEYKWMTKSDTMWFCLPCREKVERNIIVDREIEDRCKDMAAKFEKRIKTLEDKMQNKCEKEDIIVIVQEEIKKNQQCEPTLVTSEESEDNVQSVISELNERKARESNLVIYGVEETITNNKSERYEHDKDYVLRIADLCGTEVEQEEITKITRLGRFNKEDVNPKRPLLVAFKDQKTKVGYFKGGSRLRDSERYSETRLANDLTQKEREAEKKLYTEAKEMEKTAWETSDTKYGGPRGQEGL